jgi:CO dehydrogenase maturation factor
MAYAIALAGKGGVGKTTTAGLLVRYLIEKKKKVVLAVDADANSCLNEALGVEIASTVGRVREESLDAIRSADARPAGMTTEQLLDYKVQQSIVEASGFDLIAMGRPEGAGCYCAANNIIRKYSDQLADDYSYMVIDNEAGMEHLSRRTTHKVNLLLMVSDPTVRGIKTIQKIQALVDELKLEVERKGLLINRTVGQEKDALVNYANQLGIDVLGTIPNDETVFKNDIAGKPVFELPAESPSVSAIYKVFDSLNIP